MLGVRIQNKQPDQYHSLVKTGHGTKLLATLRETANIKRSNLKGDPSRKK